MTPVSGDRRERERHEMREAILDAAMALFVDESFDHTTMRRIAQAIEYTPGALYSYFKDKDAILYALHRRGFDKLFAKFSPLLAVADPVERLFRMGELYLEFAFENPKLYDLMFISRATGKSIEAKDQWDQGEQAHNALRAVVASCMDAGRMRRGDVEAISFAIWSTVHGMASLLLCNRCVMIPEEERPALIQRALRFLNDSFTAI